MENVCFGCSGNESEVGVLNGPKDDGEGGVYFLCENCEEEARILFADFVKYEL